MASEEVNSLYYEAERQKVLHQTFSVDTLQPALLTRCPQVPESVVTLDSLFSDGGGLEDTQVLGGRIAVWRGDITTLATTAIVNAANEGLLGGGGIDEAIHKAAGPLLQFECALATKEHGLCMPGNTIVTKGYALEASYVLHTVAPYLDEDGKPQEAVFGQCFDTILNASAVHNIASVAVPCIGTGFYGYPLPAACDVAVQRLCGFLAKDTARASAAAPGTPESQWQFPHRIVLVAWTKGQEKLLKGRVASLCQQLLKDKGAT